MLIKLYSVKLPHGIFLQYSVLSMCVKVYLEINEWIEGHTNLKINILKNNFDTFYTNILKFIFLTRAVLESYMIFREPCNINGGQ